LRADFYDLPAKQTQWQAFLRKSGLRGNSSLHKIILIIQGFVMPVVEGILTLRIAYKVVIGIARGTFDGVTRWIE